MNIYEEYSINNLNITRHLGHFDGNSQDFIPAKNIRKSVIERRGNFHGIELKCMVNHESPLINFPVDFKSYAPYYSNKQVYDLTNVATGVYIDVLHSLEKNYNFSTKFYHRKDGKWGSGILANGTIGAEGMLLNLVEGSADMVTPFSMILTRSEFIDFGPAITPEYLALYIPKDTKLEHIDWMNFVDPFTWKLWISLFSTACIFAICTYIMEWSHLNNRPVIFFKIQQL